LFYSIDEFKANHGAALFTESFEPQSYKEALSSDHADKCMSAFKEEYESLMENKTWKLVPFPSGSSQMNCKWIGKVKPAYGDVPERYKGRLVAIGSRQKYGVDYDEVFAPVPHQEAVKATLAEIASLDLEIIQFDIKTAFLYATLDKLIYMKQPEGFVVPGKEDHVRLLEKSLYGLKQAPRLWHKRLDAVLTKFGLKNSTADKCIYIRRTSEETTIVMIHVDDGIAASNKTCVLDNIGEHLSSEFKMHSVPPTRFIGLNIHRDRLNRKNIPVTVTHDRKTVNSIRYVIPFL
jgi:Reverse transcriptase (RNA-dependent DNA polymerase)